MTDLPTLIARLEKATQPTPELFRECFIAVFGDAAPADQVAWRRWCIFQSYLSCIPEPAWLEAAMLMVPEDYRDFSMSSQHWRDNEAPYKVKLYRDGHENIPIGITTHWVRGMGNTLPNALLLAALRARFA